MCVAAQNHQTIYKNPYLSDEGHPRSLILVSIERQCPTSYTNRKSVTGVRLTPKSMTMNELER